MTLKEAKRLTPGTTLYHKTKRNTTGALTVRVSGRVKTWKRNPERIAIPVKYGLYDYGYLTNGTQEGNGFVFYLKDVQLEYPTTKKTIWFKGNECELTGKKETFYGGLFAEAKEVESEKTVWVKVKKEES